MSNILLYGIGSDPKSIMRLSGVLDVLIATGGTGNPVRVISLKRVGKNKRTDAAKVNSSR